MKARFGWIFAVGLLLMQAAPAEAKKPSFVTDVQIQTDDTTLSIRWSAPPRGAAPDRYAVVLRDAQGERVEGGRLVIQATDALQASYKNLEPRATYKVSIRGLAGKAKGRPIQYVVALGSDVVPLSTKNYMYFIKGGEPTPEDAIGAPTRHVKLIDGVWQRFDPGRAYKANQLWWYYDEVSKAEEALKQAEAKLAEWKEANPDIPIDHPVLASKLKLARQAVDNTKQRLLAEEEGVDAEIARRYPPEDLGIDDDRWVERPKR